MSKVARALGAFAVAATHLSVPVAAQSQKATIVMTGMVPTVCEARFARAPQANGSRTVDLGVMTRRCNNGEGYRITLHTIRGLSGAVLVMGSRRVPLSDSGETVILDSNQDERAAEPAFLQLAAPMAGGSFPLRLHVEPKGTIYG